MHKKSMEAADTLNDDDEDEHKPSLDPKEKDELRTESIASLRAKAQRHSAKVLEVMENSSRTNPLLGNLQTPSSASCRLPSQSMAPNMSSATPSLVTTTGCSLGLDLDCLGDAS